MRRLRGIVVSEGMARGPAVVIASGEINVREARVPEEQKKRELSRLERALQATRRDIRTLKNQTEAQLGEISSIIDTYLSFLQDEQGLLEPIRGLIRNESWDAPSAVVRRFREVATTLSKAPEPLRSRVPDLLDIERRIVGHLLGKKGGARLDNLPRHVIIIADDLTPSQAVTLDREHILAFATDRGGPASHTAILARHLGIPAIVGLGNVTREVRQGDQVIVDGLAGEVVVAPDDVATRDYQTRAKRIQARARTVSLVKQPPRTHDGFEVTILGNIDAVGSQHRLRERGVRGVGLFRTEFLYLGKEVAPDEDVQTRVYRGLLEAMAPDPVAIRTMDFGADKWDHRVSAGHEPNPFLGMRSIRLSFAHEGVFRAQLRAILRASVAGNAKVLFPMVSDVGEFVRARDILRSVMEDMRGEGVPFDEGIRVGAMVEVPSAAIGARTLLEEADFLSLGTNDLTQYTLAVDRTNPRVADLFCPHHPSVLRLIKMAVEAAEDAKKPITACGEMAGLVRYAPVLLGLGVTSLSMAGPRVAEVVQRIRRVRMSACRELASALIAARDAADSARILDAFEERLPRRAGRLRQ